MTSAVQSPPYRLLRRLLGSRLQEPVWPDNVYDAGFDPDRDLADVHALLTSAYPTRENPFASLASWSRWLTTDSEYAPEAIFLARSGQGQLLGVCQCWTSGFIKDLAVAPGHRRRGIGEALLLRSFGHFARAGACAVDLKVGLTNETGAERLYRRLGMIEIHFERSR